MELSKQDKLMLLILVFGASFMSAFWGAFELALQSPSHPVWSGTWGYPVPHHYIVGFVGMAISFIMLVIQFVREEN